jgi:hypothetical protein
MCLFQLLSFSSSLVCHLWPSNCRSSWAFLWKPFAQNYIKWLHFWLIKCVTLLFVLCISSSPQQMVALYHCAFSLIIRYILFIIIHKRSEKNVSQQLLGFVVIEVYLQERQVSFVEVSMDRIFVCHCEAERNLCCLAVSAVKLPHCVSTTAMRK